MLDGLLTLDEIARAAGASWWATRALIRRKYEAKLIRRWERLFLAAADAEAVVADLKTRRRQGDAPTRPLVEPGVD